jgi:hypothetical protein
MGKRLGRAGAALAAATFLSFIAIGAQAQDTMGAINGMMGNSEPDGTSLGVDASQDGVSVDSSSNYGGWKGGELDIGADATRDGVTVDGDGTIAQGYAANLDTGASVTRDGVKANAEGMMDGERMQQGLREKGVDIDGIEVGDINVDGIGVAMGKGPAAAVAGLSESEARQLSKRCIDVLDSPASFDAQLIQLCRVMNSR